MLDATSRLGAALAYAAPELKVPRSRLHPEEKPNKQYEQNAAAGAPGVHARGGDAARPGPRVRPGVGFSGREKDTTAKNPVVCG